MDITVALTTIPSRLPYLEPTLKALLAQSLPPKEIVLALPQASHREGCGYEIPAELARLEAAGQLRILRCQYDWGPATKFIPLLFELRRAGRLNEAVVVVDDDTIYDPNTLSRYALQAGRFPDAVLTVRGGPRSMKLDDFFVHPVSPEAKSGPDTSVPQTVAPIEVDIVTGAGSFLIRPAFVADDLLDYASVPREAFLMDDDHISGYLASRGVRRLLVPLQGWTIRSDWGFFRLNSDAFDQNPLRGWRLDLRLPIIRHYEQYWSTIKMNRLGLKLRLKSIWWSITHRSRCVRFNDLLLNRPANSLP